MNNPLPSNVQAIIFIFGSIMFSVAFCSSTNEQNPNTTPTNVVSIIDEEKLCELPTAVAVPILMCNKSTKPFNEESNTEGEQTCNENIEEKVLLYNKSAIKHAETLVTKTVSTKRSGGSEAINASRSGIPQMGFKIIKPEETAEENVPTDSYNDVLGKYLQLFG